MVIVFVLVVVGAGALLLLLAERDRIPSMRSPRILASALSSMTSTAEERRTTTATMSPDAPSKGDEDALTDPQRDEEPPTEADVEVMVRRRLYGPRGG